MLNGLLKYNELNKQTTGKVETQTKLKVPKGHLFDGMDNADYRMAQQYHQIMTNPKKFEQSRDFTWLINVYRV